MSKRDYPQADDAEPVAIELKRYADKPGARHGIFYEQCCSCNAKHTWIFELPDRRNKIILRMVVQDGE